MRPSEPVAAVADEKPPTDLPPAAAEVKKAAPHGALHGGPSLLVGSISLKPSEPIVATPHIQVEVKPLTQEDLERYWTEAGLELGISDLLRCASVKLGEQNHTFEVVAETTYFDDEFKPHKMNVLEKMRKQTGMQMLDCKVIPLYISKDALPYSADDKYKVMFEHNHKIADLAKIFPNIDM